MCARGWLHMTRSRRILQRRRSKKATMQYSYTRFKTPCLPLIMEMINRVRRACLIKIKCTGRRDSPALNYHREAFRREKIHIHMMQLYIEESGKVYKCVSCCWYNIVIYGPKLAHVIYNHPRSLAAPLFLPRVTLQYVSRERIFCFFHTLCNNNCLLRRAPVMYSAAGLLS